MARTTGFHAIEEVLRSLPNPSVGAELFVSSKSSLIRRLIDIASRRGIQVTTVSRAALDRLAAGADHRGAMLATDIVPGPGARASPASTRHQETSLERVIAGDAPESLMLVLDHVTDPHNLGAILRSADQFSVDLVILPARRSAGINETVARTSAGASAYVPVHVAANIARCLDSVKKADYWVYGAEADGVAAVSMDLTGRIALVIGSEGKGISPLVKSKCDGLVSIPTSGKVSSLNVSVATGILLYEIRRQQVRKQ